MTYILIEGKTTKEFIVPATKIIIVQTNGTIVVDLERDTIEDIEEIPSDLREKEATV